MHVIPMTLKDVFVLEPKRFGDARGFFSETFNERLFHQHVPGVRFVQDNHSLSREAGVLRGLHFQRPPHAQGKLVRVTRGRVQDVIVDLRKGSPTYGAHEAVELSAENWRQLWVPPGFAHAFCTLEPDTEFVYKVTDFYAPEADDGLRFDDPDLGIAWPFPSEALILSDKDRTLGSFKDFDSPFTYEAPERRV
ncbi:dTDP-4-dehydrorhamnose 3,5-epimerase [Eilatimonas milleporae]|uniref:dTDP-4-dehydrorhamnose 3,5-epimerase n=1 Tax=Eilatimonas milleporae TaxID=911205 RepID=A0A3M0CSB8_9PROT|nr:dTDP-4-dehydrorhamnose 3,5-epimerase [Eilatimonas milleporae]RMB12418.1 dTDP-4-dehydrorhamnose 3,5-epimerase [Eilatimonas milleporae]